MIQVQQIVDSLLPDLPLERSVKKTKGTGLELQVICRDSFALELARDWVLSSLPRMPAIVSSLEGRDPRDASP